MSTTDNLYSSTDWKSGVMGSNLSPKHHVKIYMNHIHIFTSVRPKICESFGGIASKIIPSIAYRGTPTFVMNICAACEKSAITAPPPFATLRQSIQGHCNDEFLTTSRCIIQFLSDNHRFLYFDNLSKTIDFSMVRLIRRLVNFHLRL